MDKFVGKKPSLNAMAYQGKLLWHMERAPMIAIWKSRIRKIPLLHVLYLGGSESMEKSASSLVLPEAFQCNDIKTITLSRFLTSSARKCLVQHLQFAQLHNPLQNLSQICGFWRTL